MKTRCSSILNALPLAILACASSLGAQEFRFITNSYGTISIVGYIGPGGPITVPDNINGVPVTCIGPVPWYGFVGVTSITLPPTVTSIENGAFSCCAALASVNIPPSVTNIGNAAFFLCTSLTNIELPDSVTSIGETAFQQCTSLTRLSIPHRVTFIGGRLCRGCDSLTAVDVDPRNPAYASLDGVLFNHDKTTLLECPGGKDGSYTVPEGVTSIAEKAFTDCASLIGIAIGPGLVSIGYDAFAGCVSLRNVSLPQSLVSIGPHAFVACTSLVGITIPPSVTNLWAGTFQNCVNLTSVYFLGNPPSISGSVEVFPRDDRLFIYYRSGTSGWGPTYDRHTTVRMDPPISPFSQTAEFGCTVRWQVGAVGPAPACWLLYHNTTNLVLCATNADLLLSGLKPSHAGVYTAVLTNTGWAATSPPAILQVIPPVQRRPVPGIQVRCEPASILNLDYSDSLAPPGWIPLGSASMAGSSQFFFDLNVPLPPQRFYRAWRTGAQGVALDLSLQMVPAITINGEVGGTFHIEYINRLGPIDAWVSLATMTLTSSSQIFFDTSAVAQPERLYRATPVP